MVHTASVDKTPVWEGTRLSTTNDNGRGVILS